MPLKIDELLQNRTVFVLGAGSSKDYNFPLWEELKPEFLKRIVNYQDTFGEEAVQYWTDALNSDQGKSVDFLAHKALPAGQELFQFVIGDILLECENSDAQSKSERWIEIFCQKLLGLGLNSETSDLLQNLSFVNFNYDRCFDQRYLNNFIKPLWNSFPSKWTRLQSYQSLNGELAPFCSIPHPHGTLGAIGLFSKGAKVFANYSYTFHNPEEVVNLDYGDLQEFEKLKSNDDLKYLPVDAFLGQKEPYTLNNDSYRQATDRINTASNVIIIGMSNPGWSQQLIEKNSDATYWSTSMSAIADYVECLGMYAEDFVSNL